MSNNNSVNWPGWNIVQKIGSGSFGTVYEIQREIYGNTERAALKVISIPRDPDELEYMRCTGMDDASITHNLHQQVSDIAREYNLMAQVRGNPNIVHCDDFRDVPNPDALGWNIYIKMELLTPLNKRLDAVATEAQIIRLGKDICNALIACQNKNIIHRDIKPQNIFIAQDGRFKLGDFGIARTMSRGSHGTVGIGTYSYMAPEIYHNKPYDQSVDLYSLGLLMYWLLNERRMPFMPLPPQMPQYTDDENSRRRRFDGETLPPPKNASAQLTQIVLKACAYDPNNRYADAQSMYAALESLQPTTVNIPLTPTIETVSTSVSAYVPSENQRTDPINNQTVGPNWNLPATSVTDNTDATVGPNFYQRTSPPIPPTPPAPPVKKKRIHPALLWGGIAVALYILLLVLLQSCKDSSPSSPSTDVPQPSVNSTDNNAKDPTLESNPITIVTQPAHTFTSMGDICSVSVEAIGEDLTYQWYVRDIGETKDKESTQKKHTFQMGMSEENHGRQIYCIIKDKYGNKVKTDTVTLRLKATIITQPSDAYAKKDAYAKTTVSAVGEELTYQWYARDTSDTEDHLSSQSSYTYKAQMNESSHNRTVYCIITDKYGNSVRTDTVKLMMEQESVQTNDNAWSSWSSALPSYVSEDSYTIETETVYQSRTLETTTSESSELSGWELYNIVVPDQSWSTWSDWSTQAVQADDNRQVKTKTQYRYRKKETCTDTASSKDGWTLYDSTEQWSDYGAWSSWSPNYVSQADTRDVESKTQYSYRTSGTQTIYSDWSAWSLWSEWDSPPNLPADQWTRETSEVWPYYYFKCPSCGAHMHGWQINCPTWAGGCGTYIPESAWVAVWYPTSWSNMNFKDWYGTGKYYTEIPGIGRVFRRNDRNPITGYRYATRTSETIKVNSDWSAWSSTAISANDTREVKTRTIYRSRTRSKIKTYYYYRWGKWSSWSSNSASESNNCQVEKRTIYSYCDKLADTVYCFRRWSDWSDETTEPVTPSDTVEVKTKTRYRFKKNS